MGRRCREPRPTDSTCTCLITSRGLGRRRPSRGFSGEGKGTAGRRAWVFGWRSPGLRSESPQNILEVRGVFADGD